MTVGSLFMKVIFLNLIMLSCFLNVAKKVALAWLFGANLIQLIYFVLCTESAGSTCLYDHKFPLDKNIALIFGSETNGIPDDVFSTISSTPGVYIPMQGGIRSYNLANSAALVISELRRQQYCSGEWQAASSDC